MILAATLVCIVIAIMLAAALTKATLLQYRQVRWEECQQQSFWLAESGVQRAVHQLHASADYSGETWEISAETLGSDAAGTVVIQVQPTSQPQAGWDVRVESRYPAQALPRAMCLREVFVQKFVADLPTTVVSSCFGVAPRCDVQLNCQRQSLAGLQPAPCLPPASSRWLANLFLRVSRLQPDLLTGLQASGVYHEPRCLKAAREASLKRAVTSVCRDSHHHVNVVADGVPAEGRQMLPVRDAGQDLARGEITPVVSRSSEFPETFYSSGLPRPQSSREPWVT